MPTTPTTAAPRADPDAPETVYRRLRSGYEAEAAALRRRAAVVTRGRLATFLGSLACLAPAVVGTDSPRVPWLVGATGLFAVFAVLVAVDARLGRRIARLETLRDVNDRSLARRAVELSRLVPCPPIDELFPAEADQAGETADEAAGEGARTDDERGAARPAFARDLSLFGPASLFRLVSTAHTPVGRRTLARWLVEPAGPDGVAARQAAARTLAPRLGFRQEVEALASRVASGDAGDPDLERFYAWAEGEPWLARRPLRLWTARLLTLLVPGGLVAAVAGVIPWSLWVLVAMAGYLLSAASAERLHEIYDRATVGGTACGATGRCCERSKSFRRRRRRGARDARRTPGARAGGPTCSGAWPLGSRPAGRAVGERDRDLPRPGPRWATTGRARPGPPAGWTGWSA